MKTITLGRQVRAAAVAPSSIDQEARTVELVWSTGAAVKRSDWMSGKVYNEELSMAPAHVRLDRLNSGAPLLAAHDRNDLAAMIGVVERAWLAGNEGRALVRFSTRADVDPVWRDVADGIIRNVSVGYKVNRYQETTAPGDKIQTFLAVDWEPEEISLVSVGADAAAGVRAEVQTPCEIVTHGPAAQRSIQMARYRLSLAEREV